MPSRFQPPPDPGPASSRLARQAQAKLQQALVLHRQGLLAQAKAIYLDILRKQPRHADSLHLLGVVAHQTGDHQRAVDLFGKAIAIDPDNAACHSNRGNALQQLGRFDAAVTSFDRAIAIEPRYAEAFYNRGNALSALRQHGAAVASYDQAIAIDPGYAAAFNNRGLAQKQLGQFDAAIASYERAIALAPGSADAFNNRGVALHELDRFDAAVASYDQAVVLRPDYAEAFYNRGNALRELRQLDAAVASYDRAIALKPDYADAGWNKALALLLAGDFDRGWALHEWRWKVAGSRKPRRDFAQRLWLGGESLDGRTILLHCEQGLGDTIQFCRYAKPVAELGARVIIEAPPSLVGLLQELEGVSALVATGTELPPFDLHCPLLSLPLALRTNLDNIPSGQAYLRSDPGKLAAWSKRLGSTTARRVGIVWSGGAGHRSDRSRSSNRSLALAQLLPHLPQGPEYVCLQKELRDADRTTLQGRPDIRFYGDQLDDFSDTAALCDLMDVVVSVDTSVAHLAGAMGKRTLVMLPYSPDWRWLLDRTDSVWYPSVRLRRQSTVGDWTSVLDQVRADLLTPG